MSNVKLIPTGLDHIISPSATLSAWGYRPELFTEEEKVEIEYDLFLEKQRLEKELEEINKKIKKLQTSL